MPCSGLGVKGTAQVSADLAGLKIVRLDPYAPELIQGVGPAVPTTARFGASLFKTPGAVSMSLFGPHLNDIFPGLEQREQFEAVYVYYHLVARDAKSKNKFVIKDMLVPYLKEADLMDTQTALFNLNKGIETLEAKLTSAEVDRWRSVNGDSLVAKSLREFGTIFSSYPAPTVSEEMLITPLVILFIAIAKRGSATTGWINRHGATLNTEHRFLVTDLSSEVISEVWASLKGSVTDGNVESI